MILKCHLIDIGVELESLGINAHFFAIAALALNINGRGRIVTDQYDSKAGWAISLFRPIGDDAAKTLANALRQRISIQYLRRHKISKVSAHITTANLDRLMPLLCGG
mgnify:CR=1 FL=1